MKNTEKWVRKTRRQTKLAKNELKFWTLNTKTIKVLLFLLWKSKEKKIFIFISSIWTKKEKMKKKVHLVLLSPNNFWFLIIIRYQWHTDFFLSFVFLLVNFSLFSILLRYAPFFITSSAISQNTKCRHRFISIRSAQTNQLEQKYK